MNKLFTISILCCLFLQPSFGQDSTTSIKMISEHSSKDKVLSDFLFFEKIDYYQISFVGEELKNKQFSIISKEVWNGEITKVDTIASKMSRARTINNDTLKIRVVGKHENSKLRMLFKFPRFGFERVFDAIDSKSYSLRDIGTLANIELNKPFYALAYILPYEKDGAKLYCEVDYNPDIDNWGKKFGIGHYLLFEMKFE